MFDEIDKPCPACGLKGIWACSDRNCPMKDKQTDTRKNWQERRNSSGDESEAK